MCRPMPPYVWSVLKIYSPHRMLQKDLCVFKKARYVFKKLQHLFKKARHVFNVRADGIIPPLIKSVIPSCPFILTFQLKRADNQPVKNDGTSPHPPFSRASQAPSKSAFSNVLLWRMKGGWRGDEGVSIHYRKPHQQGVSTTNERREEETVRLIWERYNNIKNNRKLLCTQMITMFW